LKEHPAIVVAIVKERAQAIRRFTFELLRRIFSNRANRITAQVEFNSPDSF